MHMEARTRAAAAKVAKNLEKSDRENTFPIYHRNKRGSIGKLSITINKIGRKCANNKWAGSLVGQMSKRPVLAAAVDVKIVPTATILGLSGANRFKNRYKGTASTAEAAIIVAQQEPS